MNTNFALAWVGLIGVFCLACGDPGSHLHEDVDAGHGEESNTEVKGPNGGRLLTSGEFTLELAIVERGIPPEFRAWATKNGKVLAPRDVSLQIVLTRLGGRVDRIAFAPQGDFLRGDSVVYEPHSFEVSIEAVHAGNNHAWNYENFEGRTRISSEIAHTLGIETETAGPAVLHDTVTLYGRIRPNAEQVSQIRARFDGTVRNVHAQVGSTVNAGQKLLTIESNESLNAYSIRAPIDGVVTQRDANPGEQTSGRLLLTVTDTSSVWAELSVFPHDRNSIRVGSPVVLVPAEGGSPIPGVVSTVDVLAREDQSVVARVVVDNPNGELVPGTFVNAEVTVAAYEIPLAVKRVGLQAFRDFTVVYAQVGDEYEVRMLDLGREAGDFAEVLGGLDPGTRYVTENSYIIKADVEKSGASHDH